MYFCGLGAVPVDSGTVFCYVVVNLIFWITIAIFHHYGRRYHFRCAGSTGFGIQ